MSRRQAWFVANMEAAAPLGKLVRTHAASPVAIQRAAVVGVLSFVFFLVMLFAFYARMQLVYFMLASAFLVVYIFTMIGLWLQKRNVLRIYQNGLSYRSRTVRWNEIVRIDRDTRGGIGIVVRTQDVLLLPASLDGLPAVARTITSHIPPTN
ncbi:hypothetical protein BH24ACI3_BH24ACI3_14800 [soil metagenome]